MSRPSLAALPRRSPGPLTRKIPMWVREPHPDGRTQWRMYRRMGSGHALVMEYWTEPGQTRAAAAQGLRKTRDVLYGRDKIKGLLAAAKADLPNQSQTPAANVQSPTNPAPAPGGSQGSLF